MAQPAPKAPLGSFVKYASCGVRLVAAKRPRHSSHTLTSVRVRDYRRTLKLAFFFHAVVRGAELEDAWATIRRDGIEKTTHLLETAFEPGRPPLNQHETLALYNVVYDLTTRTGERNCSAELYRRHGDVLREYCRTSVLPKVQHLAGDFLLAALLQRWNRFYVFQRTMARIFQYLERCGAAGATCLRCGSAVPTSGGMPLQRSRWRALDMLPAGRCGHACLHRRRSNPTVRSA